MASKKVVICGINTSQLPVLSAREMADLMVKLKRGDESAREEFIFGNIKLVLSVCQRFGGKKESIDDIFQVGCVGLIKAIDNFDMALNVKFSTYAVPMIIGEIRRFLRDSTSVRVSRSLRDVAYKVLKSREKLIEGKAEEPSLDEIAEDIGIPLAEVVCALDAISDTMSLDEPAYNDGQDSIMIMDQISDTSKIDEVERITLMQSLNELSKREKQILLMRYFIGKTQVEISNEVGISQAQVSRLEKNALNTLKKTIS